MHQLAITLGTPRVQRLLQRVEHEVGLHGIADPPADDAPREDVDDEGHVHEALPGRDVGVSRPREFHPQPLAGRVEDWRADLGSGGCSSVVALAGPAPIVTSPAPATSNATGGF